MDGSTLEWNFSGIFGAKDRRPFTKFLNQILLFRSLEIKKKTYFYPLTGQSKRKNRKIKLDSYKTTFLAKHLYTPMTIFWKAIIIMSSNLSHFTSKIVINHANSISINIKNKIKKPLTSFLCEYTPGRLISKHQISKQTF